MKGVDTQRFPITFEISEAPRPQGGASRKGGLIYIVPLDPAYKAGLARHLPARMGPSSFKDDLVPFHLINE